MRDEHLLFDRDGAVAIVTINRPAKRNALNDQPIAKLGRAADLNKRTLTNLYNARPSWLDNAHKELDAAVATIDAQLDQEVDVALASPFPPPERALEGVYEEGVAV